MKRIAIIGSGGAGKTTLGLAMSECLDIPVFHLDRMYWQPGWVLSDHEDVRPHLEDVMARDTWIIDGNYGSSIEERIRRADTVIFLDMPVWVCVFGAVRRYFQYRGTHRPDMTEGNNERLTLDFLGWIFGYRRNRRPRVLALLNARRHDTRITILRSRGESREFVRALSATGSSSRTPSG